MEIGKRGEELDICSNMETILWFQWLKGWGKFYILQYQWKRIMVHDSFQCVWGFEFDVGDYVVTRIYN